MKIPALRLRLCALSLLTVLLVSAGCREYPPRPEISRPTVEPEDYPEHLLIGQTNLAIVIADTDQTRAQGLSGRERLLDTQGMLFNFRGTNVVRPAFWMKDMKFDLDLIWLKDRRVIGITPNVLAPKNPTDSLPNYSPPSDIDMVLEVNAGWADQHGIKVGDEISTVLD